LFASGGVPMDINSLVQFVLRESYMETAKDLAFHADKVKMFNQTKTALRDHLTTIRDTAATLQDGDTLEIPVSSSEVSEDGSQVNVEQTLTLTKEEAQELLEVLDQPLENAGDQTTANEATDLSPIIGGSITVARAEAEIGASSSIGPGNQVEDISFENIDDLGEALSEAEGRIDALQDQIQDINDQINAEEANITGLLEIINEFTIGITEMQSWISDLISDIQILTDELEKMEDGDIRTITSRSLKLNPDGVTYSLVEKTVEMDYSEIQEEIVKKNAQITQVEEKIQEAKFRIEENKEYIEQGKEKIKGFERKINELQKEIAQVQEVIIQIQEQIAEYRENETK
jgi:predicted  nucleic acid-binding Zn-ribbon protein